MSNKVISFSPREQRVMEFWFGLDGNPPRTVGEVAMELGVSPSRIYQIKANVLRKHRLIWSARGLSVKNDNAV